MLRKLALAALLSTAPMAAQALEVVNTGPVPASPSYYVVGGSGSGSAGVGGRFTLSAATSITALEFYGAASGLTNFGSIRSDGATPGAVLYSGAIASTDISINQWVGLTGLNWLLGPGSYWMTVESRDTSSAFREGRNFPNPLPQQAVQNGGVWSAGGFSAGDAFAFRLEGNAIEAGVPEPATWATMIAGFGLVGGAMRRRRVDVAFA